MMSSCCHSGTALSLNFSLARKRTTFKVCFIKSSERIKSFKLLCWNWLIQTVFSASNDSMTTSLILCELVFLRVSCSLMEFSAVNEPGSAGPSTCLPSIACSWKTLALSTMSGRAERFTLSCKSRWNNNNLKSLSAQHFLNKNIHFIWGYEECFPFMNKAQHFPCSNISLVSHFSMTFVAFRTLFSSKFKYNRRKRPTKSQHWQESYPIMIMSCFLIKRRDT